MLKIKRATISLIFFLLFFSTVSHSQSLSYGITGNIGLSGIDLFIDGESPDFHESRYFLSGNAGLYVQKQFTSRSSIGLELLWVRIRGVEKRGEQFVPGTNGVLGIITENVYRNINYFGIPIYYRYSFNKLGLRIGMQALIHLSRNAEWESIGELNGSPFYSIRPFSNDRPHEFDYGPKLGLDYELNERFILRADYYHGFKSVVSYSGNRRLKNRQLTVGLNYNLNPAR